MLASDVNNPEFVNPVHPDSVLHVEFYWYAPVDKWKSESAGKEIHGPRIPYICIMRPGDNTSIHRTPVRDDHKVRFARQWLAWQVKENMIEGSATDAPGWKLDDWPGVKGEQVNELKYLRFSTVEQVAGASDAQIQRLGLGGIGLREQARAAIKERNKSEYAAEMEKKDKEINEMRDRLAKLEAMLTAPKNDTLHVPKKGN